MVAMTSGWLSHRTFTFALKTPPTIAEYLRYMAVGWFVSAVNYGVFVIILLLRPVTEPLTALLGSSVVAMFFAYFGMRFAAFRVDAILTATRAESPQIDASSQNVTRRSRARAAIVVACNGLRRAPANLTARRQRGHGIAAILFSQCFGGRPRG
jgi:hypothetical protein